MENPPYWCAQIYRNPSYTAGRPSTFPPGPPGPPISSGPPGPPGGPAGPPQGVQAGSHQLSGADGPALHHAPLQLFILNGAESRCNKMAPNRPVYSPGTPLRAELVLISILRIPSQFGWIFVLQPTDLFLPGLIRFVTSYFAEVISWALGCYFQRADLRATWHTSATVPRASP